MVIMAFSSSDQRLSSESLPLLDTFVFEAKQNSISAYVMEARPKEGLFCKQRFSRVLVEQTREKSNLHGDRNTGLGDLFTMALDEILKELKNRLGNDVDHIGTIICLTEHIDGFQEYNRFSPLIECKPNGKQGFSSNLTNLMKHFQLPAHDQDTLQSFSKINQRLIDQFGFNKNCMIIQTLPGRLTSFVSSMSKPEDVALEVGLSDYFFIPTAKIKGEAISNHGKEEIEVLPNPFFYLNPNPTKENHHKPWLLMIKCKGAGKARKIIRDEYTKTWKSFKHLVQVISVGGNAGLDDKLFLFFLFFDDHAIPTIRKYEFGTCVTEFNDLRANPRCTLEGQALHLRRMYCQIKTEENDGDYQQRGLSTDNNHEYWGAARSLPFKPFDQSNRPKHCRIWPASQNTSSIELECLAEVVSQVIGAPCYVSSTSTKTDREAGTEMEDSEGISNSIIGATYISLFAQNRFFYGSEVGFDELIHSYHLIQNNSLNEQTGIEQDQPLFPVTNLVEEQHGTPRAAQRKSKPLAQPRSIGNVYNRSENDGDCTPTLQNRLIRSVSSAADLMRESMLPIENSSSPIPSSPLPIQSRTRSISLSISHQLSVSKMMMTDNQALSSSPNTIDHHQYHQYQQTLSSPPTSVYEEHHQDAIRANVGFDLIDHSDEDLWVFYGAMLEEYVRLFDSIQNGLKRRL